MYIVLNTTMDNIKTHAAFLRSIATTKQSNKGKDIIKSAKPKQLDVLCEILLNILRGTIELTDGLKKKAAYYKTVLRRIVKRCLKKVLRKKLFIKYFNIIKRLIAAALPVIGITLSVLQFV